MIAINAVVVAPVFAATRLRAHRALPTAHTETTP
jgi:hypothetical protein